MDEATGKGPHPVDRHVGARTRWRRLELGMSQSELGDRIGVSFQAVQKYEAAGIRFSASRLYLTAGALDVAPGYFFDGYRGDEPAASLSSPADEPADIAALVRGYRAIRDDHLRTELLELVIRLGDRARS